MPPIVVNKEDSKADYDMRFDFPDRWKAVQYDAPHSFYRDKKFENIADSKSVDIVAIDPDEKVLWLIEVKDFRAFPRKDTQDIIGDIVKKVRDTLSCIFTAAFAGKDFEQEIIKQNRLRVVFHLEQPVKSSKLYPQILDRRNGTLKMKQRLRVFDPHPVLCNIHEHSRCPWAVSEIKR